MATKTRAKVEPKRFITLVNDVLTIRMVYTPTREETDVYTLTRQLSGTGFVLMKTDGVVYRTTSDTCTCPGFVHHGRCKHRDGMAALIARGQL